MMRWLPQRVAPNEILKIFLIRTLTTEILKKFTVIYIKKLHFREFFKNFEVNVSLRKIFEILLLPSNEMQSKSFFKVFKQLDLMPGKKKILKI